MQSAGQVPSSLPKLSIKFIPRPDMGGAPAPCSMTPRAGSTRDGCGRRPETLGIRIERVQIAAKFLAFAASRGDESGAPPPRIRFPGLKRRIRPRACAQPGGELQVRVRGAAGRAGGDARGNAGGRPAGSVEGARARHALNEGCQLCVGGSETTATAIQLVLGRGPTIFDREDLSPDIRKVWNSSLRLAMSPVRRVAPLEFSLGVMPNQVAK